MQLAAIQFRLKPTVESCDTYQHITDYALPRLDYKLTDTYGIFCFPQVLNTAPLPLFLSLSLSLSLHKVIKIWTVLNLELKLLSKVVHTSLQPTDHLNHSLRCWQTTKMAGLPAKCSFAVRVNITSSSYRDKDEFFPLNKCVVKVKEHLRSCNLLGTNVTEYDLILAMAGKFNLSHEELEKMVVCPAHRHRLGIHWRSRKSSRYPGQEGKKIALHCKNPINQQMAQEIREMFVQVRSRKYIFNCSVLNLLGCSILMKWQGINKWGKRVI